MRVVYLAAGAGVLWAVSGSNGGGALWRSADRYARNLYDDLPPPAVQAAAPQPECSPVPGST
ncbi:MAG: hypothetical protein IH942_07540 [Acidobacteria bacterium]|nr:hypothetical protein [Acidobacteriota bacterium]